MLQAIGAIPCSVLLFVVATYVPRRINFKEECSGKPIIAQEPLPSTIIFIYCLIFESVYLERGQHIREAVMGNAARTLGGRSDAENIATMKVCVVSVVRR